MGFLFIEAGPTIQGKFWDQPEVIVDRLQKNKRAHFFDDNLVTWMVVKFGKACI